MSIVQIGNWRKRTVATLCAVVVCLSLVAVTGCTNSTSETTNKATQSEPKSTSEQATTRTFTDSTGRSVEIPVQIDKIAPSGHTAQQVLLTMAPEKMVGLSQELSKDQLKYFEEFANYPVFGAAFGSKGDMNKESVAAAGPQIVIDTGEYKEGLKEDLENLQAQLGIPVVFIETPLDGYENAYAMLGELLGEEERGKELGSYCATAYNKTKSVVDTIPTSKRVNFAYLMGDTGLNAIAKGSYQGTVIDMCTNNVVVVDKASGSGAGNEINLEQIAVWNPELVVFGTKSIYDTVGSDSAWASISAVADNNYYEVPSEPWTWLNNPPSVNQIMGMQWLSRLCYPDAFDDSMQEVVTNYYKTFYNYDLSKAEYDELMIDALPH